MLRNPGFTDSASAFPDKVLLGSWGDPSLFSNLEWRHYRLSSRLHWCWCTWHWLGRLLLTGRWLRERLNYLLILQLCYIGYGPHYLFMAIVNQVTITGNYKTSNTLKSWFWCNLEWNWCTRTDMTSVWKSGSLLNYTESMYFTQFQHGKILVNLPIILPRWRQGECCR